ncbi:MAG: hypothetical protein ACOCP8_06545 [archaeon]
MRVDFQDVWFKNFLCYGDVWNHISLQEGINLILSDVKYNKRSNSMGKSSALMSIVFVLFGKVIGNVKKADIVNWQNGKNCEVHLKFIKDNDVIYVKRGIKPDIFEIYINDIPIPKTDVPTLQNKFENEILGWNISMFKNLIYANPNNIISLLDSKAQDKRKFIEDLFSDIEYFSKLMKKTNEKLRSIEDSRNENNVRIDNIYDNIDGINDDISELKKELNSLNNNDEYEKYKKLESEYNELLNKKSNIDEDIDELEKKLEAKQKEINEQDKEEGNIENQKKLIDEKIKALKKEYDTAEQNNTLRKELEEIDNYLRKTEDQTQELDKISREYSKKEKELKSLNNEYSEYSGMLKNLKKQKPTSLSFDEKLKNISCPNCGYDIDIKEKSEEFVKEEQEKIDKEIKNVNKKLSKVNENIEKLNSEIEELSKKYKEKENLQNKIEKARRRKEYINELIKNFRHTDEILKDIKDLEGEKETHDENKKAIDKKLNVLLFERDDISSKIKNIRNIDKKISDKKSEYQDVKNRYERTRQKINDFNERIKNKNKKITNFKKERLKLETKNKKLNELHDYFSFLKETLKDENIKSYVINIIIPHLNKKVNEYLSKLGFDFFVKFDDWLNISIYGPGGRDGCGLGNMSGGAKKAIDLLTKISLIDIAQIKYKIYPNILIFDEILDTSIDEFGIEKLIEIINHKQQMDNLKIFLISHRKEINELVTGRIYKIRMKNNFSSIKEF